LATGAAKRWEKESEDHHRARCRSLLMTGNALIWIYVKKL
jgi:hypothetical protein